MIFHRRAGYINIGSFRLAYIPTSGSDTGLFTPCLWLNTVNNKYSSPLRLADVGILASIETRPQHSAPYAVPKWHPNNVLAYPS